MADKVMSNNVSEIHKRNRGGVVALVAALMAGYAVASSAANFVQTDWSTGVTANTAVDPTNLTGWTEYSAADAGLNNSTDLTIVPSAGFTRQTSYNPDFKTATNIISQTNNTDFNAGSPLLTNTRVAGGMIMTAPAGLSGNWVAKPAWDFTAPAAYANAAYADLDGDGDLDMIVMANQNMWGYRNDGDGDTVVWTPVTAWNKNGNDLGDWGSNKTITLYDLDGDGDYDLLYGSDNQPIYGWENQSELYASPDPVWVRNSTWDLTYAAISTAGGVIGHVPRISNLIDMDGLDGGKPEIVIGGTNGSWQNVQPDVFTFDLAASPHWVYQGSWRPTGSYTRSPRAIMGDLDNDLDPDMLVGWQSQTNLQSLPNSATGFPVAPVWQDDGLTGLDVSTLVGYVVPSLGDVDNDGDLDLFIGSNDATYGTTMFAYENVGTTYYTSATYTSDVLDSGTNNVGFDTVNYTAVTPANTTLTLDMRSGPTVTPDASWTAWSANSAIANGGSIAGLGDNRYVQYRFNFSTSDTSVTAYVKDISINFIAFPLSTNITTYDDKLNLNVLSRTLAWNEAATDWSRTFDNTNANADSWHQNIDMALGDLNNDGWVDMIVGDRSQTAGAEAFVNNGDNTWTYTPAWNIPHVGGYLRISLGDLDGDGDLDALIGQDGSTSMTAYRNGSAGETVFTNHENGPPDWQAAPASWNINHGSGGRVNAALADLDGDGDLDAMVSQLAGSQTVIYGYENQSVGNGPVWVAKPAWDATGWGNEYDKDVEMADVDGDGDYDLLIAGNVGDEDTKLLLNTGTINSPTWSQITPNSNAQIPPTPGTNAINFTSFWDLDNDGDQDVLIGRDGAMSGAAMTGASSYAASGTFTSSIMDFNNKTLTTLTYDASIPGDSALTISVRAGDAAVPGAFWTAWAPVANGGSLAAFDAYRYLQYKVDMTASTGATLSPIVRSVKVNYTYLPSLVTLTSSAYNTTVVGNFMTGLAWTESLAASSDVRVQLRTSPDNATWTSWMGPDGTSGTYWSSADPYGGSCSGTGTITCATMASSLKDGSSDQWFQYKVELAAAVTTPTLSDITLTYVPTLPPGITLSKTTGLAPNENGTADNFTVVLDAAPSASVTINLSSTVPGEAVPTTSVLTFTTGNWSVPQQVDVTAINDAVDDGDIAFAISVDPSSVGDAGYNALATLNVSGSAIDDDTAGITLSRTSGLVTTEATLGSDTFTVVLDSKPTADVRLTFSSSDTTEGTVSPSEVTFTQSTWNVAKTITVTGVDEGYDDGDIAYNVVTGTSLSTDTLYHGINPSDVGVTNVDDDTAGIFVNPATAITTSETGTSSSFTVVLGSQPTSNVTVSIASSNLTEATLSPGILTFTGSNWNTAQTVTVTGVDDGLVDGDIGYTVLISNATSGDPAYDGYNLPDINAVNTDDDIASFVVTPSSGLTTTEAGGQAIFFVRLGALPVSLVTLDLAVTDSSEGTLSTTSLVFNSGDWNFDRQIVVTGVDDAINDGDQLYNVTITPRAGSDVAYSSLPAANVSITNTDNDGASFTDAAFTQSDWRAGPVANQQACLAGNGTWTGTQCVAVNPGNQAGWQAYLNKENGVEVINNGADIRAQVVNKSMSLTNNADFGLAGNNRSYTTYKDFVSGSVSQAKINNGAISLKPQVPSQTWAATANTSWNLTLATSASSVDFADLDGDGDLDMMAGGGQALYGYRNIGTDDNPQWQEVTTWGMSAATLGYDGPNVVALGDLDGDGLTDMLLSTQGTRMKAFRNIGNAGNPVWQSKSTWVLAGTTAATVYYRLALGYLDGNTKPDLLIGGNWSSGPIEAWEFDNSRPDNDKWVPQATWNPPSGTGYPAGPKPTIGDFDEDGDPDIVVGWGSHTDLQLITNLNTGFPSTPNTWSDAWGGATGLAGTYDLPTLVDIDSDGDLDIMVGESSSANLTVYENTSTQYYTSGTYTSAVIDAGTHDGFNILTYTAVTPANTAITIDMQAADSADMLTNPTGWVTGLANGASIAALGNRRYVQYRVNLSTTNVTATPILTDLSFSLITYPLVTDTIAAGNSLILKIQNRTHAWTREATWDSDVASGSPDGNNGTPAPSLGDMDGDGDLDMIRGDNYNLTLGFYENDGTNTWTYNSAWNIVCCSGGNSEPRLVDIDNDGDQDLALYSSLWSSVVFYENIGTASAPVWDTSASPSPQKGAWEIVKGGDAGAGVDFADLDLDGDLDAMVGDGPTSGSKVLGFENVGSDTNPAWLAKSEWDLPPSSCTPCSWWLMVPTLADIDGDGDYDMLVGNSNGTSYAYENIGTAKSPAWNYKAAWNPPTIDPGTATAYTRSHFALNDLDGDGDVDMLLGGNSTTVWGYRNTGVTTYVASGTYESEVLDFGTHLGFTTVNYDAVIRTGTSMTVEIRSGNTAKPDVSWTAWASYNSGDSIASFGTNRYVQYKISMTANAGNSLSPSFNSIDFNYTGVELSTSLQSTPFDTTSATNIIKQLWWDESLAAGTDIHVQLRTAPDNAGDPGTWSEWVGPDGSSNSYWNSANTYAGGCSGTGSIACTYIPPMLRNGMNNQWLQYKITFISTGDVQATLSQITTFFNSASDGSAVVTLTPTSLTTTENVGVTPTATFNVTLSGTPTANVDIYFGSEDISEGTVSPAMLTFSAGSMGPKTVTVTAVDDAVRDGDIAYSVFTSATVSSDAAFDALTVPDVTVTNTDDDTALGAINLSKTSGLITTEAGGADTFTVVLASQPTADVRISMSASDTSEGLVTPSTLLFTSTNWNTPQTVTVTGLDDNLFDQTVSYSVITGTAASSDTNYNGLNPPDVAVSNTDNDSAEVTITPDDAVNGLTVSESGAARTFAITLASQPTSNVYFTLSSSDMTEGTVLPFTMITFTPSNWNVPQYGTVFGVEDNVIDGNVAFNIVTSTFMSMDPNFNGVNPPDIAATNVDNDGVFGVNVWPTTISTGEDGSFATVNFELQSKPTSDVIIELTSSDVGEAYVPSRIILRPDDITWRGVTVNIYGVDDDLLDADQPFTITTSNTISADPNFNGLVVPDITGTNVSTNFTKLGTGQAGTNVGRALAMGDINGDGYADVAYGAPGYDSTSANAGRVSLRLGQGTQIGLVGDYEWTYTGSVLNGNLGQSVAIANVNGDAYADLIVGAPGEGNGGTVYVFFGPITSAKTAPDQTLTHATVGANFGFSVANAGKVNNDIYDDVIIGAYGVDQAYVYHGSATGISAVADMTLSGTAATQYGISVSSAGDVNGDGFDDVIVGANLYDNVETDEGAVYAYYGSSTGVVNVADWTMEVNQAGAYFGYAVAGAGDVNKDGYDDVIIGAYLYDNVQTDEGRVYVYHGSASGLSGSYAVTIESNQDGAHYGYSLASAGDVNHDGFSDIIVGAPTYDTVGVDEGRAVVYHGSVTGVDPTPALAMVGDQDSGNFGAAVAGGGGTIDSDNYDDYTVGADLYDVAGQADEGYVYVYRAPPVGAGIVISPTSGLQTTEAGYGNTVSISIVLTSPPKDNVTIESFSGDTSEGYISSSAVLTFTPANWNSPQTINVTGINDSVDDGDVFYDIVTVARSTDTRYNGIAIDNVTIMNVNDDYSVAVDATDSAIGESGLDTGTFTFSRTGSTAGNLLVEYTVSGTATSGSDYQALSGSVTIPAGQSSVDVVVTPVDDAVVDSGESVTVTLKDLGTYVIANGGIASMTIVDNDAAGVTVNAAPNLQTTEAGASASFTVVLNSAPTANVTIGLSTDIPSEGLVTASSLVFTSSNWNTPQTVSVIGVDDAIVDGDALFYVVTATAVSSDPAYGGVINPVDVAVTNIDDDVLPNVTIIASAASVTEGSGANGEFTISRTGDTSSDLVVGYAVSGTATTGLDFYSLGASAVIPAGSSSVKVPVVVKDDALLEQDEQVVLSLTSSAAYVLDLPNAATVTIADNDQVVLPKVNFSLDQTVGEGGSVTVTAHLDKPATSLVTIPFTISGTATYSSDHDAVNGSIVINSGGHSGLTTFNVVNDGITGEPAETVIFTMGAVTGADIGVRNTHTVTIVEANVAPVVTLTATQGIASITTITNGDGNVTVQANVVDKNPADTHTYDWSATNASLVDINDGDPSTFVFDPVTLLNGYYKVRLTVTDSGSTPLQTQVDLLLEVVTAQPTLSAAIDTDGDGIADVDEPYDLDGDGIVDYLDNSNLQSNQLQLDVNNAGSIMSTDAGLTLRLGDTAFAAGGDGALVSVNDIATYGGGEGNAGTASATDTVASTGDYYDFEVAGLPDAGQSVRVVIPATSALPANAVYRKYDPTSGWSNFVEDGFNSLASAPGAPGDCPPSGDAAYVAGLNEGYYCMQLTIQDGGPNDQDGAANHVIEDPAEIAYVVPSQPVVQEPVAQEPQPSTFAFSSRSGGGALSPWWIALALGLMWRRRMSLRVRNVRD